MQSIFLKIDQNESKNTTESLRSLRTNLRFCGDDIKTIMVTSSMPNEGKSTVSYELAKSLAESNNSVLLLDTDMRKSVLAGRLGARTYDKSEIKGLSHYLTGQADLSDVIYTTENNKLFIVFAGPAVPNPTEILEKKYFEKLLEFARSQFDYVIVDCAPIGAAIDAAVVAKHCDGAIFVIAQGTVSSRAIMMAKKQLEVSGVRILGAVLNKVSMDKSPYGKYYGSYYGQYYSEYSEDDDK